MKKIFKFAPLMLIASLLFSGCQESAIASTQKNSTQKVTRGNLILGLSSDGRVALPVTNLNFSVEGTISKIHVNVGDTVKAGDLLAELDDSDYQIAITNAKNNLNKAQVSYEDAIKQYDYSLLNNEMNLASTERKLNDEFDPYTYELSIEDAKTSLARKQKDLEDAIAAAQEPFDDYTYQNTIKDAQTNLERKIKDLETTKQEAKAPFDDYTYQNAINDAKINLDRKKADLATAQDNLYTAENPDAKEFDAYTYENSINSAQTTFDRKEQDYNLAIQDYYTAWNEYNKASAKPGAVETELSTLYKKYTDAQKAVETSLRAVDDARASLEKAKNDKARAEESYSSTNSDDYKKTVQDAQTKVDSAKNTVSDAERSYNKAKTDLERAKEKYETDAQTKITTAETAVSDAQKALDKAHTDLERAIKKAADDAQTKITTAQTAVTDAETALLKAETNLERARIDFEEQKSSTKDTYELQSVSLKNQRESTTSITNALLTIEEMKLKLQEAEHNLEKVKIYAPKDGQIINITSKEGEKATARQTSNAVIFGTSSSGSNFMTLCDVTQIYLTASITEGDVVGLSVNQEVRVTVDSLGEDTFMGKVLTISNIPTTDSNGITTYTVTCKLNETNTEIKDGMNTLLNFIKKEKLDVLLIPNKAVFVENNQQYVNVELADGTLEKRAVSCGLSNGTQTEVLKGLEEGETVVVGKVKA